MDNTFTIVIATPQSEKDFKSTITYRCLDKLIPLCPFKCDLLLFPDNSIGLSELYQKVLSETTSTYILFMHDDLEIHDMFLFDKLIQAHTQFDIVGLAGTQSQDYRTNNLPAWHLCQKGEGHSRGIVSHFIPKGFQNCESSHINSNYFGPSPSKVVVIDGLFISIKVDKIPKGKDLFDKKYTFHFYDMCMSANAIKNQLSIGVWPIFVVHHGLGEFHDDELWNRLAIDFKSDYGMYSASV
jgi:hypothetical protein